VHHVCMLRRLTCWPDRVLCMMQGPMGAPPMDGAQLPQLSEVDMSVQCDPRYMRFTVQKIPNSQANATTTHLPLGTLTNRGRDPGGGGAVGRVVWSHGGGRGSGYTMEEILSISHMGSCGNFGGSGGV
jgi:hypothetical protein